MMTTQNARHDEVRSRALDDMRRFEVVMEGHFDYGNGFHGKLYLNPHKLFQWPSTIWRVAQDLIDVLPVDFIEQTQVVAGPATGGALLAHTVAGLLDGRRPMTHPPYSFAPFGDEDEPYLSPFYAKTMRDKRVLLVDDVRNTGTTFKRCAELVVAAGGTVVGTVEIIDRCEACVSVDAPNVALVEYTSPPNYPADDCPLCAANVPITTF
jgi:orotate phosphoribosyltransferase